MVVRAFGGRPTGNTKGVAKADPVRAYEGGDFPSGGCGCRARPGWRSARRVCFVPVVALVPLVVESSMQKWHSVLAWGCRSLVLDRG